MHTSSSAATAAFTRLELALVLATLGILATVNWPALAVSARRSERVACENNLRQLGRAVSMWAADHDGIDPWWVRPPEGTYQVGFAARVWYQCSFLSNEIANPKVLVCPSDPAKTVNAASDWGAGPTGFMDVGHRDNSVSYLLALHGSSLVSQSIWFGDRNVLFDGTGYCSLGLQNIYHITLRSTVAGWTNNIHGITGNLLLHDGRVIEASRSDISNLVFSVNDNGSACFLTPSP
jgi:hypothetical protein